MSTCRNPSGSCSHEMIRHDGEDDGEHTTYECLVIGCHCFFSTDA